MDSHAAARVILGLIRLINGGLALLAPQFLCRNVGLDPDATPAANYVFRLFGIRTVLIGLDLLFASGHDLRRAVAQAPLIHASDTAAAGLAAVSGRLPGNAGKTIVTISAINTLLAVWAWRGLQSDK